MDVPSCVRCSAAIILTAAFGLGNAKRILNFGKLLEGEPTWAERLAMAGVQTSAAA